LPTHLPREVVTVELPENERFTEDGQPLRVIGKEISEKLVFEPSQMKVIEVHRCKYGVDSGEAIKTAPPIPSIIPKGIATPSLLAALVTAKYADGLPLYRQEDIFSRQGVDIPRCTMARWIVRGSSACMPIWNVLEERLMATPYTSCDETHTQVLKEKNRRAESKSWMWVRATPGAEQKIVLFDYDPSRSGDVAKRLFTDFKGFLQVDGYCGYTPLEKQPGIIRIGCNMHGRRGFEKAAKEGAKNGRPLAEQGLKYYQLLYDIEGRAKESCMSWSERKVLRDAEAGPIWDEMKVWAETNSEKVPPKSKIGEAFHYFLGEFDLLKGYLLDGCLEIDNGFAERMIRKFAIGRNNWMFSDTEGGAHASALFYSFVITAKINGVNPYKALTKLFEKIPLATTIDDFERLADLLLYPEKSV
jgi:transposase